MENALTLVYVDPQSGMNLAQYDYSLLNGLDCEVTYCCSTMYDAAIMDKVKYKYIFNYNNINNSALKGLSYTLSVFRLLFILMLIRPDVLHIQWWKIWRVDYMMIPLYKFFAKQIVFTAHNVGPHDTGDSMIEKSKMYYSRIDKIIVHANRTKEELIADFNVPAEKVYVIPHGILSKEFDRGKVETEKKRISEKYNLQSKLVFGALGWQNNYKGTDTIKEVFLDRKLLENNPDVFLFVAGKGDIIKKSEWSLDNLYLNDGFVDEVELEALLELTDVLLLPYKKISQSGMLLTAIDLNIPYIATDIGGICEPLNIAQIGWKMKGLSSKDLQEVIEDILKEKSLPKKIKSDTDKWNKVKTLYDWASIQEKTMACYND